MIYSLKPSNQCNYSFAALIYEFIYIYISIEHIRQYMSWLSSWLLFYMYDSNAIQEKFQIECVHVWIEPKVEEQNRNKYQTKFFFSFIQTEWGRTSRFSVEILNLVLVVSGWEIILYISVPFWLWRSWMPQGDRLEEASLNLTSRFFSYIKGHHNTSRRRWCI